MKRLTLLLLSLIVATSVQGCWSGDTYGGSVGNTGKQTVEDNTPKKTWDPVHNKFKEDSE